MIKFDFVVIIIVALIFYKLGTTSYFESIYFKRAKKFNKNMTAQLKAEQQLDSTTSK